MKFQQSEAKELLLAMLSLNPLSRISANDALKHLYFKNGCAPTDHADLNMGGRDNIKGDHNENVLSDASYGIENPNKLRRV